jgi:hypothetical protein
MMLRIKIIGFLNDIMKFGKWVPFQRKLGPLFKNGGSRFL